MLFNTILGLVICVFLTNTNALETCKGPSADSQEDFYWKYHAASIAVYGSVIDVKNNNNYVVLKVNCVLKGELTLTNLTLIQPSEVADSSECHYLRNNKQYLVFLQPTKSTTQGGKTEYRLADMEEIEITKDTASAFINDQCSDEEDYGTGMTLFYYNNDRQCASFKTTCDGVTRISIPALKQAPLTESTIFLGGLNNTLASPKLSADDAESISGKQGSGIGDEHYHNTAMMTAICMPLVALLAGLVMIFDI